MADSNLESTSPRDGTSDASGLSSTRQPLTHDRDPAETQTVRPDHIVSYERDLFSGVDEYERWLKDPTSYTEKMYDAFYPHIAAHAWALRHVVRRTNPTTVTTMLTLVWQAWAAAETVPQYDRQVKLWFTRDASGKRVYLSDLGDHITADEADDGRRSQLPPREETVLHIDSPLSSKPAPGDHLSSPVAVSPPAEVMIRSPGGTVHQYVKPTNNSTDADPDAEPEMYIMPQNSPEARRTRAAVQANQLAADREEQERKQAARRKRRSDGSTK